MTGGTPATGAAAPAVAGPAATVAPRGHVGTGPVPEGAGAPGDTRPPRGLGDPALTRPTRAVDGAGPSGPGGASPSSAATGHLRFGPGVQPPRPSASTGSRPARRPQRARAVFLVLVVIAAALWWWAGRGDLDVHGVTAGPRVSTGCHEVAVLRATVHTDGDAGELTYRWLRSDGTRSDVLRQRVVAGQRSTDLVLHWQVRGVGRFRGEATAEVLAPEPARATTAFDYVC